MPSAAVAAEIQRAGRRQVNPIVESGGQLNMRAIWNNITIAQSDDTIVVEGNHYFPLDSVVPGVLHSSRMKSLCPWTGLASYYHIEANGARSSNGAWTYRHPYPWIRKIKSRVAFWNGIEVRPGDHTGINTHQGSNLTARADLS